MKRHARVAAFERRWFIVASFALEKAIKKGDQQMRDFGKMALAIKPEILRFIARNFIKDASTRHNIAFYQWRKLFNRSPKLTHEEI